MERIACKISCGARQFYWFSDGIYAEGTQKNYSNVLGAKLVKVEGIPVQKALESIKPLVPAENDQYFKAFGLDYLAIPEALHAQHITKELKKTVTYTFEKDGKTFEQSFNAVDAFRFPRKYGFVTNDKDWVSSRNQNSTPHYLKDLEKYISTSTCPDPKPCMYGTARYRMTRRKPYLHFIKGFLIS
ncbi:MAG: hypothetical protein IPL50_10120 [Chitinophagaceae bacterium]|nr:hypothetical protein [Chitinophagaceae bacterium]